MKTFGIDKNYHFFKMLWGVTMIKTISKSCNAFIANTTEKILSVMLHLVMKKIEIEIEIFENRHFFYKCSLSKVHSKESLNYRKIITDEDC